MRYYICSKDAPPHAYHRRLGINSYATREEAEKKIFDERYEVREIEFLPIPNQKMAAIRAVYQDMKNGRDGDDFAYGMGIVMELLTGDIWWMREKP